MSVDPAISVFQGSQVSDEPLPISPAEQFALLLPINWDNIPGTNVRIFANLRPEITGAQSITYRLRHSITNPVGLSVLGSVILDSALEAPGGPRNLSLDSGVIAKPSGIDVIQISTQGSGGSPANTTGTVVMGVEPDANGPIVGYSNLLGFVTYSLAPETFLTEYRVDWDRFSTPNVRVSMAIHFRNLNFAASPLNLRLGGTYHGVDGTVIATVLVPINFDGYQSLSAVIANPGGISSVKVTFGALGTQFVSTPTIWIQEA